jgi:hypothetical protein
MSTKKFAAVLFASLFVAGFAAAAETPASFDPSKCKVEYPKASLMNEEQGVTSMSFPGQRRRFGGRFEAGKVERLQEAWTRQP